MSVMGVYIVDQFLISYYDLYYWVYNVDLYYRPLLFPCNDCVLFVGTWMWFSLCRFFSCTLSTNLPLVIMTSIIGVHCHLVMNDIYYWLDWVCKTRLVFCVVGICIYLVLKTMSTWQSPKTYISWLGFVLYHYYYIINIIIVMSQDTTDYSFNYVYGLKIEMSNQGCEYW
jgi:hypothetical protein